MKTSLLVIVVLVAGASITFGQRRPVSSSGGVLEGGGLALPTQGQIDAGSQMWQQQQKLAAARQAASQAAAYAKQAAVYTNEVAKQAAEYAAQAAAYASQAGMDVQYIYRPEMIEKDVSNAKQAAVNARKAADQAADRAEIDSKVAHLISERNEAIAMAKEKFNSGIADLDSQALIPKQRIQQLEQVAAQLNSQRNQADADNARIRAKQSFQPKDPWRRLNGKVCSAKDVSWVHFTGQVVEVRPNGIMLHGDFGPPLEATYGERSYFVENFPIQDYPMADGESITAPMNFVAYLDEKASVYQFTNTTIDLRVNTVRRLDYGRAVKTPPPDLAKKWDNIVFVSSEDPQIIKAIADNQEQQAAARKELAAIESKIEQINSDFEKEREPIVADYEAKIRAVPIEVAKETQAKEEAKKHAVTDRILKLNQDSADKGEPYGLLRMGERYRDGDGVPKDLNKARDYLTKAAAAGSPTADEDLKKLPLK